MSPIYQSILIFKLPPPILSSGQVTRTIFLKALTLLPTRETFDSNNGNGTQRLLDLGRDLNWHIDTLIGSLTDDDKVQLKVNKLELEELPESNLLTKA